MAASPPAAAEIDIDKRLDAGNLGCGPAQQHRSAIENDYVFGELADQIEIVLDKKDTDATLRQTAASMAGLKPQLRALLHYHCGVPQLRTRQMMMDLQSL